MGSLLVLVVEAIELCDYNPARQGRKHKQINHETFRVRAVRLGAECQLNQAERRDERCDVGQDEHSADEPAPPSGAATLPLGKLERPPRRDHPDLIGEKPALAHASPFENAFRLDFRHTPPSECGHRRQKPPGHRNRQTQPFDYAVVGQAENPAQGKGKLAILGVRSPLFRPDRHGSPAPTTSGRARSSSSCSDTSTAAAKHRRLRAALPRAGRRLFSLRVAQRAGCAVGERPLRLVAEGRRPRRLVGRHNSAPSGVPRHSGIQHPPEPDRLRRPPSRADQPREVARRPQSSGGSGCGSAARWSSSTPTLRCSTKPWSSESPASPCRITRRMASWGTAHPAARL